MSETWVFGYGSLAWRPGFPHEEAVQGYIKGFRRVFWQGSTDHRGTPEAPGRTVTLHPDPAAVTWGVAYRLAGDREQQARTKAYLEHREKQYDKRHLAHIYTTASADSPVVQDALVYVATDGPQNVNWLGPAPLQHIAAQIAAAHGPSGPNWEYLFRLADAMREMRVDDEELFQLEAAVRQLLPAPGASSGSSAQQCSAAAAAEPDADKETTTTTSSHAHAIQIAAAAGS